MVYLGMKINKEKLNNHVKHIWDISSNKNLLSVEIRIVETTLRYYHEKCGLRNDLQQVNVTKLQLTYISYSITSFPLIKQYDIVIIQTSSYTSWIVDIYNFRQIQTFPHKDTWYNVTLIVLYHDYFIYMVCTRVLLPHMMFSSVLQYFHRRSFYKWL